MTPWQQVFEDQQLVKRLEDVLHSLDGISLDGLQAAELEQYSRLLKVLKFIRARLKSIDPELVSQTSLNNMGNWLTNIANHIASFLSSKDFAYIQNANTTADSILDVVRAFRTTAKEHEQAIGGATTAFRDRIIQEVERVSKQREKTETELTALQKEIASTQTALNESNRVIEQQKGRLDQSIAAFQQQFSDSEAGRSKEFTAAMTKLSEQITNQVSEFKAQFEEDIKERKAKGDEHP